MSSRPQPPDRRGFAPGPPLKGEWNPAGSKSIAQRALVLAGLCPGETRLAGVPAGADVDAARELVCATSEGGRCLVQGRPPGMWWSEGGRGLAEVGESGTLARFAMALAAFAAPPGREVEVGGSGSLGRRQSKALQAALSAAGASCEPMGPGGTWPVRILAVEAPVSLLIQAPASSQEVSALLICQAAHGGGRSVVVEGPIPSLPYVGLTRSVLSSFGVQTRVESDGELTRYLLEGALVSPSAPMRIEPDASSAAVALAAACITGGSLRCPGLLSDSAQGDVRVWQHLAAFGCEAGLSADGLFGGGRPRHGAILDLAGEPDLAPPLAAVAACAALDGHESELRGLGSLSGKESDRIAVLAGFLGVLGLQVEAGTGLRIQPGYGSGSMGATLLDPRGDHRMAFAGALLGLLRPGIQVLGPGCVAKSWPGFWSDLEGLGAQAGV